MSRAWAAAARGSSLERRASESCPSRAQQAAMISRSTAHAPRGRPPVIVWRNAVSVPASWWIPMDP